MEKEPKLIIMPNIKKLGELVNENLKLIRNTDSNFMVNMKLDRFANSEGKASLLESVRGQRVFILCDVGNYNEEYSANGMKRIKSSDDHFQDLKRVISSIQSTADSIHVITPLLYSSRQDKSPKSSKDNFIQESLDCRDGIKEIEMRNVDGLITFDVHNVDVCQNAVDKMTFDNLYPTHVMINEFLKSTEYDPNNTVVIAPDTGATKRAEYFRNVLQATAMGYFTKERDYTQVIDGKNPIKKHEYKGDSVLGKDVIIADDIIASGGSILDTAERLKALGARNVYMFATFPLFSPGEDCIKKFDEAYKNGTLNKLFTTNLTYVPDYIKEKEWFHEVDLSNQLALAINAIANNEEIDDASHELGEINKQLVKKR